VPAAQPVTHKPKDTANAEQPQQRRRVFPFLIECKKTAEALTQCKPEWWSQAQKAALAAEKRPAVIWASDRRQIRVTVNLKDAMECIARGRWSAEMHLIEIPIEGFAYLCREGMC